MKYHLSNRPFFDRSLNLRPTRAWSEMDELFNQFFSGETMDRSTRDYKPNVDLHETKDYYVLSFDMPGIKKEDVQIDVKDNVVRVHGERKYEATEQANEDVKLHRRERYFGSFDRSFQLPENIETSKVEAHFENGVLELVLPKSIEAKSTSVKIQDGQGGFLKNLLARKDAN